MRTPDEINEMVEMIQQIKFFKDRNIKDKDVSELCTAFKFEHFDSHSNVFKWGDQGEKFYIIIKGQVSVQVPNPKIKNWRMQRMDLNILQDFFDKL